MTRWLLVVVCSLGMATVGCDDADEPFRGADSGAGGARMDAAGTGGSAGGTGTMDALVDRSDTAVTDTARLDAADARDTSLDVVPGDTIPNLDVALSDTLADRLPDLGVDVSLGDGGLVTGNLLFTAANGGTLTIGQASLAVPKGALASDKLITVSVRMPTSNDPSDEQLASAIYDFGPDGTTFDFPVPLTLPMNAALPAGKDAVVAWLDQGSNQWFPVASTVSGLRVTGMVSHFTSFAVMLLDKGTSCPFSGACGGTLDGVYDYQASCFPDSKAPLAVKCGTAPDIYVRQQIGVNGTITFTPGRFVAMQSVSLKSTIFYTPECLTAVNGGVQPVFPDCAAVQTGLSKDATAPWTCAGTLAQGCSCTQINVFPQAPMGAVVIDGQSVTFNEDGKPPGKPAEFCSNGRSLLVKDASGAVYTARKR